MALANPVEHTRHIVSGHPVTCHSNPLDRQACRKAGIEQKKGRQFVNYLVILRVRMPQIRSTV